MSKGQAAALLQKVRRWIEEEGLFPQTGRIVAALSGGADSLAMTAMLRAQIDFGGTPPSFRQGGAKAVSSVPVQKVEHHLDEVSLMEEEAEAKIIEGFLKG